MGWSEENDPIVNTNAYITVPILFNTVTVQLEDENKV